MLLISVPPILGHAGLATLDIAAAATCLLALYTLENWLASGRWEEAVLFGVTSGIAVATKFSAVPFIALSLLALGLVQGLNSWRATRGTHAHHPWRVLRSRATGAVLAALAALVPLLAVYAVRSPDVSGVEVRFDWAVNYLISQGGLARTVGSALSHAWLPRELTDLVNGVIAVKAHNDAGHRSYLLGQVSLDGWWYFYLVTLAVKTPLPLLAGGSLGLACLAGKGWRARDGWALAPLVLVLAILGFASLFSRINIGIRHVLILYPFLALGGAYLAWRAWQACRSLRDARLRTAVTAVLIALLLWQVSTLWRAYPDYLPYFNETVREPWRVLVDSDLDWGQDLRRLEIRAAQLHVEQALPGLQRDRRPCARAAAAPRAADAAPAGARLGGDLGAGAHPPAERLRVARCLPTARAHRAHHRSLLHPLRVLGAGGGTQARNACQRRRVRVVERRVHRVRGQGAGVVTMQLDERGRELPGAGVARGELVGLEFVLA